MSNDEDDLDWEEWMEMSDEQHEAILDRMMKQHEANLARLNRLQLYQYYRARRLELCLKQRKMAREWPEIFGPMLRSTQRRLVEARVEYWTGAEVGHS
jgi:hypothetical protein